MSSISLAQMIPFANWTEKSAQDIGLRAYSTAISSCATSDVLITKPAGTVANDVLFAQIWTSSGSGGKVVSPPAGWQTIRFDDQFNGTYTVRQYLFYKVAGGAEAANYNFTSTGTSCVGGGMVGYYNVKTAAPVDVHLCSASNTTAPATAPSITLTKKKERVLYTFLDAWAVTVNTTWPFTREVQWSPGSDSDGFFMQDRVQSAAGATGAVQAEMMSGNDLTACQIALKPSGTTALRALGPQVYGIYGAGSDYNMTLTKPAGVVSGDVMIARLTIIPSGNHAAPTYTAPAGWTLLRTDRSFIAYVTNIQYLFYKVAGGSEPANYAFTTSSPPPILTVNEGVIVAYSGVDNTTPIDAHGCGQGLTNTPAPSITTTSANTTVLHSLVQVTNHDATPPRARAYPWSKLWENADNTNSQTIMGANVQMVSAGPTAALDFITTSGNQWVACQVGIVPAP